MRKSILKVMASAVGALVLTVQANAAIILNGTEELNAMSISESFSDFYGRSTGIPASSNTGFEEIDTAVFMLLENSGSFALLGTFGAFQYQGDQFGGSLTMSLTNDGFGSIIVLDDPAEANTVSGNTTVFDFVYADNRTDGFVLDLGDGSLVDVLVGLTNLDGLSSFEFIDSSGSRVISSNFTLGNTFNAVSVPAPSMFLSLGIFFIAMSLSRRSFSR